MLKKKELLEEYVPVPGLYIFYTFGAGPALVMDFMPDGRLKVTGESEGEHNKELYMLHEASKHFLTELLALPFEELMPNDERYEDCLIV